MIRNLRPHVAFCISRFNLRISKFTYLLVLSSLLFSVTSFSQSLPFSLKNLNLPALSYSAVAWGDYDHDGDLDVALSGLLGNDPVSLILTNNNGNLVNNQASLPALHQGSVEWGDFDNDHDLDLLITGINSTGTAFTFILKNNNGIFSDSGISLPGVGNGNATWGDVNNDGKPDILLTGSMITKIFVSNGDETFSDSGVSLPGLSNSMASWCDYNNDGRMDILLSGDSGGGIVTKLFENEGGTFNEMYITPEPFTGLYNGQTKWADLDNDGDQDLVITGTDIYVDAYLLVYRNDGNENFTKINLPEGNLLSGSVDINDYNADGLMDIIEIGRTAGCGGTAVTLLWKNTGNMVFQPVSTLIPGFMLGGVAWGDYNNDGYADLLFSGLDPFENPQTALYLNNLGDTTFTINTPPSVPSNPVATGISDGVKLSWSPAHDYESPKVSLSYNVMIGTQPGMVDILSPLSDPSGGNRMLSTFGNMSLDTTFIIKGINPGTYYFSVQTIDNGFLQGAFSDPVIFQFPLIGLPEKINDAFLILPNPCSHYVTIQIPENSREKTGIRILDINGKIVLTGNVPGTFDMSPFPAGIYMAEIYSAGHYHREKIVKL